MTQSQFVRGACRIVVTDSTAKITAIEDIIQLDEGPNQYDLRFGFDEFGVSRTGLIMERDEIEEYSMIGDRFVIPTTMRVKTQIAEAHPQSIINNWAPNIGIGQFPTPGHTRTLIFLTQKPDKSIVAWIFERCLMLPIELGIDFRMRGEATAIPVEWIFSEGYMLTRMERQKPGNVIEFTNFDEWRATLESA
jgi:hypothetical protein